MSHRIVRSLMTVFFDPTGSDVFDINNLEPIALAQSYALDITKNTTDLVPNDLADPAGVSQWTVPEPSDKSWTLSCDALVLIPDTNNPEYDPTGKADNQKALDAFLGDLKVWILIDDSDTGAGDNAYIYGQAWVTGFAQNGNQDEFHTYTVTFTGVGPVLTGLLIPGGQAESQSRSKRKAA